MRERAGRVREMVRKEFLQLFRDPRMARILFVAPLLQLVVFGYAVSTEVRGTPLYVVDQDGTRAARELVDAFTAGGWFEIAGGSDRPADLVRVLERGDAIAGLVVPAGFEADLAAGRGRVQLLFDGTDSNTATVALGHAERIVAGRAAALAGVAAAARLELEARAWFIPELDSRNYNVPAVIGALLLLICQLLTALAVVR
jgi:ABC-2 type transport system permease protein